MTGGATSTVTVDIGDFLSAPPATENSIPPQGRDNNQVCDDSQPVNGKRGVYENFFKEKFTCAFKVPLLNSTGDDNILDVRCLWCGAISFKGRQYVLPNRGVGTQFVHILSEVIE